MSASQSPVKVAVIYYSGAGTTKNVALKVFEGLKSVQGIEADLLTAEEATAKVRELEQYDGFIFGTPTYFGTISSGLKAFFEKTSNIFYRRGFQDKLAAGFTNAASQAGDKQTALLDIFTFAAQHGLLWVPLGVRPSNNKSVRNEEVHNRSGFFTGLATQSYIDLDVSQNPSAADLSGAYAFGERFGTVALKYYH